MPGRSGTACARFRDPRTAEELGMTGRQMTIPRILAFSGSSRGDPGTARSSRWPRQAHAKPRPTPPAVRADAPGRAGVSRRIENTLERGRAGASRVATGRQPPGRVALFPRVIRVAVASPRKSAGTLSGPRAGSRRKGGLRRGVPAGGSVENAKVPAAWGGACAGSSGCAPASRAPGPEGRGSRDSHRPRR